MSNELIELKNLGKTSVQWLNAVGIHTIEQLTTCGSVAIYCKVRDRGFRVSKVFLYAVEGAITNTHWTELGPAKKAHLLQNVAEHQPVPANDFESHLSVTQQQQDSH